MEQLGSLGELERRLSDRVRSPSKQIAIIGGHYAINRDGEPEISPVGAFGIFPRYTFELSCKLVNVSKQNGGNSKIALIVDDHSLMDNPIWYRASESEDSRAQKIREVVNDYFSNFQIPRQYAQAMRGVGLSEGDFIRASKVMLPFQESGYRELFETLNPEVPATCATEYLYILSNLANQGVEKLIGLIPKRCMGPTCHGVDSFKVMESAREHPHKMNITHAYLLSNSEIDSVELLEERMKENGGINIVSWGR